MLGSSSRNSSITIFSFDMAGSFLIASSITYNFNFSRENTTTLLIIQIILNLPKASEWSKTVSEYKSVIRKNPVNIKACLEHRLERLSRHRIDVSLLSWLQSSVRWTFGQISSAGWIEFSSAEIWLCHTNLIPANFRRRRPNCVSLGLSHWQGAPVKLL